MYVVVSGLPGQREDHHRRAARGGARAPAAGAGRRSRNRSGTRSVPATWRGPAGWAARPPRRSGASPPRCAGGGARQLLPPRVRAPPRGAARADRRGALRRVRRRSPSSGTSPASGTRATSTCRYGVDMFDQWSPHRRGAARARRSPPRARHDPSRRRHRHRGLGPHRRDLIRSATVAQWGWPPARRSRACGDDRAAITSRPSTAPLDEPGRLQIRACPRAPATPRDSMPKPRPSPSLTRRIASASPGRVAFDHGARAFRREVARAEAGAAGRDDETREAVGQRRAARAATVSTPSATTRCSTTS